MALDVLAMRASQQQTWVQLYYKLNLDRRAKKICSLPCDSKILTPQMHNLTHFEFSKWRALVGLNLRPSYLMIEFTFCQNLDL